MLLLGVYLLLIAVGGVLVFVAGLALDSMIPDWSTPIFACLLFGVLVIAWPIAVRLTPETAPPAEPAE
jgi:hypothetical protein